VRSEIRRVAIAVAAGLVLSAATLALLALINQGIGLVGCVAATPLGWVATLASAVVIVVAGRVLFSAGKKLDEEPPSATSTCVTCGRELLHNWRLCPYCGSDTDGTGPAGPTGHDAEAAQN
jgi:hypothetical protein